MKQHSIPCDVKQVLVWTGGSGQSLLLLHGGWAGAEAHWSAIWTQLARRHRVIAPELPGIAGNFDTALTSYDAYADLCADLLAQLGAGPAVVVGNSLGASIAWAMARRHPAVVQRLIIVDGFPPKPISGPMRWLVGWTFVARIAKATMQRGFYSPSVLDKAFFDASLIPIEIRRNLTRPEPGMIDTMFRLVLSVERLDARPSAPVDFIWGAEDRLESVTPDVANRLQRETPGSQLIFIKRAGHLPQQDNPEAFLEAIDRILGAATRSDRAQ